MPSSALHRPAIAAASCTLPTTTVVTWPNPTHRHHHTMLVSPPRGQGSTSHAPCNPTPPHPPRPPLRLATAPRCLRYRFIGCHNRRHAPPWWLHTYVTCAEPHSPALAMGAYVALCTCAWWREPPSPSLGSCSPTAPLRGGWTSTSPHRTPPSLPDSCPAVTASPGHPQLALS